MYSTLVRKKKEEEVVIIIHILSLASSLSYYLLCRPHCFIFSNLLFITINWLVLLQVDKKGNCKEILLTAASTAWIGSSNSLLLHSININQSSFLFPFSFVGLSSKLYNSCCLLLFFFRLIVSSEENKTDPAERLYGVWCIFIF